MKLSLIYLILTTQQIISVFAQESVQFDSICKENRTLTEQNYIISVENLLKSLKIELNRKTFNVVSSNVNLFKQDFITQIRAGDFICEPKILICVNHVLNLIAKANNLDPNSLQLLVSKNNSLNAFCLPDGTFVMHLGLFIWLENEDQLASVLSHELAHFILKHSIQSQVKNYEDKNVRKKINEVTRSEKGRREKALNLYKDILYSQSASNRDHEFQADSLGYLLYMKTKYNIYEYLSAIKKLEEQSTMPADSLKLETLYYYFGVNNLAIGKYIHSFQVADAPSYYEEDYNINPKLLESHPEVHYRINRLSSIFPELLGNTSTVPSNSYLELTNWAFLEQVPNLYHHKLFGYCLYTCLIFMQKGYNIEFHKKWLLACLKEIYNARKSYSASKYLDKIDPLNQPLDYQRYLHVLWNLSLDDLTNLINYYGNE
jgi:hypothetical protein